MATTKIWAIKDSLLRVVNYASNPEKTSIEDLKQVLLYAENEDKTTDKNEKMMYVTGVNCNRETAFEEMSYTQKKYDKCGGNVAYHAYQSFKTGEVSPELAHKIGVELAQKMWAEYQVIVATHLDTGTYHNHFVVCSVNMFTGKKFNCNKGAYYRFRGLSDEICARNNLTVIKNPKGRTPRNIYFAEKRGEPTRYNIMRNALDEAIDCSLTYEQLKKYMYKKGYIINDDPNRRYTTIRSINDKRATRLYQLGEQYTVKNIKDRVYNNPYYKQRGYYDFIKKKKPIKYKKGYYKGNFNNMSKITGIEILFLLFFYLLGYRPRENKQQKHKPLSPEMKEAVRKLDRYSNQIRLVATEKLKTIEDVKEYISRTEKNIEEVVEVRQKYRNKLRNCKDEKQIAEYKLKRDDCTNLLTRYRKYLKTANQIITDIPEIKEKIKIEQQMRKEELSSEKTKKKNRYREER